MVVVWCSVLTTVNVGVAVAVARDRIVLTSHTISIGLPGHHKHLFIQLNIKYFLENLLNRAAICTCGSG